MTTRKKKFPPKIYVYIDSDGDNDYLMVGKTEWECADPNVKDRLVGVYELKEVGELQVKVAKVAS